MSSVTPTASVLLHRAVKLTVPLYPSVPASASRRLHPSPSVPAIPTSSSTALPVSTRAAYQYHYRPRAVYTTLHISINSTTPVTILSVLSTRTLSCTVSATICGYDNAVVLYL